MPEEYRTAYRLSVAFMWLRCGGTMALFLILPAFIVSLFDGLPPMAAQLAWLVPLGMALLATFRTMRILSIDRVGVPKTGTLTDIEKRINMAQGDSGKAKRARFVFSYSVDGKEFIQKSTWSLQTQGVRPSIGNRIDILVDPDNPSRAIMVDEQPVRPPPLAG